MNCQAEWAWYHPDKGYSRFFCGNGGCAREECRKLFWSRRVRLITALIEEYKLIRFFTLTLDPEFVEGDPWEYIHHPWVKMRHRLKRISPSFKFVAILERHKNRNVPHIHGFTDLWLKQSEWSRHWEESRGGKVVWIEKVKDKAASSYVTKTLEVAKYVGKDNLVIKYGEKKRCRTLWRTRKLRAKFELTKSKEWSIIKECVYKENGQFTDWHMKKGVWEYGKT